MRTKLQHLVVNQSGNSSFISKRLFVLATHSQLIHNSFTTHSESRIQRAAFKESQRFSREPCVFVCMSGAAPDGALYTKDTPFVWMAVFRHLERGRTCGPDVSTGMSGENRIVSVDVTRVSNGGRREASQGLCETSQQKKTKPPTCWGAMTLSLPSMMSARITRRQVR